MEAEVDPETGAITFPSWRFYTDRRELDTLLAASTEAREECAQAQGSDWEAPPRFEYNPLYDGSTFYGVWVKELAQQFAFVLPGSAADMAANNISVEMASPNPEPDTQSSAAEPSDDDLQILGDCDSDPHVARFLASELVSRGPWEEGFYAAQAAAQADPRSEAVLVEYHECLSGAGLEPDPDAPLFPRGFRTDTIDEEQITLAVKTVDCKTAVSFVPRMAAIVADHEAPIVTQYAQELAAQRSQIDSAMTAAEEYLAGRD